MHRRLTRGWLYILILLSNLSSLVFEFTAPSAPDRHREIAEIFGGAEEADAIKRLPDSDIGPLVHDRIASFLGDTLGMPRGLSAIGYKNEHSELMSGQDVRFKSY